MMRVITGSARGRKLKTLEGLDTRPTIERAKEAIFSVLFRDVENAAVADLFAGSGQMGIEALSRGAKSCVFVEQSREAARVVGANLESTRLAERGRIETRSVESFISSTTAKFDLIFLDPPYGKNLVNETLALIDRYGILAEGGTVIAESDGPDEVEENFGKLTLVRQSKYGRAAVRYFKDGE